MVSLRLAETPDDHRCVGTLVEPDIVLVALVRLATRQTGPTVPLATSEPRVGTKVVTAGWGYTNAPPVCEVAATALQASGRTLLRDAACGRVVLWTPPTCAARTNICTRGTRARSTINRGDSGGPLLVRDRSGAFRQDGVTALGSDSTKKLYAGFTSVPVERRWIANGSVRCAALHRRGRYVDSRSQRCEWGVLHWPSTRSHRVSGLRCLAGSASRCSAWRSRSSGWPCGSPCRRTRVVSSASSRSGPTTTSPPWP